MRMLIVAASALVALAWFTANPANAFTGAPLPAYPLMSSQSSVDGGATDEDELVLGRPIDWWDDVPSLPDFDCPSNDPAQNDKCFADASAHMLRLLALQTQVQEELDLWSSKTVYPLDQVASFETTPSSAADMVRRWSFFSKADLYAPQPVVASAIGN